MRTDSPHRRPDGREQRSLRTRARIFEAALAEFRRCGVEAASVTHIARAAGVSRPSFYFHFPTKEHVLLALQWQIEAEIAEDLSEVETPAEALHGFVDRLILAEAEIGSGDVFRSMLQVWARLPVTLDLSEHRFPVVTEVARRFIEHDRDAGPAVMTPERSAILFLAGVFGYLLGVGASSEQQSADLHALVDLHLGSR